MVGLRSACPAPPVSGVVGAAERQDVNSRGWSDSATHGTKIVRPIMPRSGITIARRVQRCRRYAASFGFRSLPRE